MTIITGGVIVLDLVGSKTGKSYEPERVLEFFMGLCAHPLIIIRICVYHGTGGPEGTPTELARLIGNLYLDLVSGMS